MDIYYVNNPLENDVEAQVVNMGEPFDSKYNDHSFIIDDSGNSGYFASDRPETGYGKDDIYQFFASSGIEGTGKPAVNTAKINVIDKKTGEPVKGAEIGILQPADNGFSDMVNSDFYSLDLVPRQDDPGVVYPVAGQEERFQRWVIRICSPMLPDRRLPSLRVTSSIWS
jgi:hypothetical protein